MRKLPVRKENMNIIVWSKNRCMQCNEVKSLLKMKNLSFEERNIESGEFTREQFEQSNPNARSFPQVHIDGNLVGGLRELTAFLKNSGV